MNTVRVWPVLKTDTPEIARLDDSEVPHGVTIHQYHFGSALVVRWHVNREFVTGCDAPKANGHLIIATQEQRNNAIVLLSAFARAFGGLTDSPIPF